MANRHSSTPPVLTQALTASQLRTLGKCNKFAFLTEFSTFSGTSIEVLLNEALDDYIGVVLKSRSEVMLKSAKRTRRIEEKELFDQQVTSCLAAIERDMSLQSSPA